MDLDNVVWASLTGPAHAGLVERHGAAARYLPDVALFHAVPDPRDPAAWADLATLAGPGARVLMSAPALEPPAEWTVAENIPGVQLVDVSVRAAPDPEALPLGPPDVPEMLDLVARTRPGPFLDRTVLLGRYLGIRRAGRLVAMAGERLHPPGWTEISAVCTDPEHRGQGLATRLIRAVAAGIRERGETPFLHTGASNTGAIRLYESMGFKVRSRPVFLVLAAPTS